MPTKTPTVIILTPTATAQVLNSVNAVFTYDGDGKMVKSIIDGVETLYVGAHYQKEGSVVTKYYMADAQVVAVRKGATLSYLLSDHLGSTSLTVDTSGTKTAEMRYKPWGEVRYQSGTTPTDQTYTGQRSYAEDFGLMYYNARWYDTSLGRFVQADTLIPPGPQGYDHYAYGLNNPSRYTDPSGHTPCDQIPEGSARDSCNNSRYGKEQKYLDQHRWSKEEALAHVKEEFGDVPPGDLESFIRMARQIYWMDQLKAAGQCPEFGGCSAEAQEIMMHYDQNQTVIRMGLKPNISSVLLDIAGIPLGFVGVGGFLQAPKVAKVAQVTGLVDSGVSFVSSQAQDDGVGMWLAAGSALPMVGGFVSAFALPRDLGLYSYEYIPPLPIP